MKEKLIKSISGIRGKIGISLFPEVALQAGKAYGNYVRGKKVIVGGDSRVSHQMLKSAVISGLLATGCEVIDIGICPTPTIELAIIGTKAAGGVGITASHNPVEWNGLKFFNSRGEFLTKAQYEKFSQFLEAEDVPVKKWQQLGSIQSDFSWVQKHVKKVLKLKYVNVNTIRKRKFKVVIDAVNGGGSIAGPEMLRNLGCRVFEINCEPDGRFPHNPEPLVTNLNALGEAVRKTGADIGFAVDPDADRLAIVDETGRPIGEEYTLAISADYILSRRPGPMVINLSTSNLNRDVCEKYGCKLHHSPVGEANVVEMMRRRKAVIGGEGNGGVILPDLHYGRDSLVGMALVLMHLARQKSTVSELTESLGHYVIVKSKGNMTSRFDVKLSKLGEKLTDQKISTVDGVRVDFDNGWVHVRKSNTEPIFRLIAEARTKKDADSLIRFIKEKL